MAVVQLTEEQNNAVERVISNTSNQSTCVEGVRVIAAAAINNVHERVTDPVTAPDESFSVRVTEHFTVGKDRMKAEFKVEYMKKNQTRIARVQPLN